MTSIAHITSGVSSRHNESFRVKDALAGTKADVEQHAQMDTQESESAAMEKALSKLDALVSNAMTSEGDPSAPEQLAADAKVAMAAKQALQLLRAIQVIELAPAL